MDKEKHVGYFDTELEAYTALQEFKKNNIQQDINF